MVVQLGFNGVHSYTPIERRRVDQATSSQAIQREHPPDPVHVGVVLTELLALLLRPVLMGCS